MHSARMHEILESDALAWAIGLVSLAVAGVAVFAWIGWLGIGTMGLIGLMVSTRVDQNGGRTPVESGFGSGEASMLARQFDVPAREPSAERRMALAAERGERSRTHRAINTLFVAMIVLGFGLGLLPML
jgi:hypothetical protein